MPSFTEGGIEHGERQDLAVDISGLLSNLSALQTARKNLERVFRYSSKGPQKIEKSDDWGGLRKPMPRKKEDFIYDVDVGAIIGAVTREVIKDGQLPLTSKREDTIEDAVDALVIDLKNAEQCITDREAQLFRDKELQRQWKAIFSRETISNQEDADKIIIRELRPFVKLWQEIKTQLSERLDKERASKKPTDKAIFEEKEIPSLAAWQIAGMDNPLDELSVQKQSDFKEMLPRIFLLPGRHQELKTQFFSGGVYHCGSSEAIVELLKLYNHQADSVASRIEMDMTLAEIREIIASAQVRAERANADFVFNREEAERLHLEVLELPAYEAADVIIARVMDKIIDITTPVGKQAFLSQWQENCPNLPPPCVPEKNDWRYLTRLSEERIISNLSGDNKVMRPNFGSKETILVDNWQEEDWDAVGENGRGKKLQTIISPLLQELLGQDQVGVVSIKREDVDVALWEGDPSDRVQLGRAKEIIRKLGLDPEEIELHCFRQDEHSRGSLVRSDWGQKNLSTNYDGYFLEDDGERYGLYGGDRGRGGVSRVGGYWRVNAAPNLAVRLVLSRNIMLNIIFLIQILCVE